jgi:hypothetical protein
MSRSRRKTPVRGITSSDSESYDKRSAAQRGRKWLHDHLSPEAAGDPDFDLPAYEHPRSGGFAFTKDGKFWFGNSRRLNPKALMRK